MITTTAVAPTTVEITVPGGIDLARCAAFRPGFVPDAAVADSEPGTLGLAFAVEGSWDHVGVLVRQRAPDVVSVELVAPPDTVLAAVSQVRRMLSLDLDGNRFAVVAAGDPVLGVLRARNPGLRPMLFHSPYEAACWAILCQRNRMSQAARLMQQLAERFGRRVEVGDRRLTSFPAPDVLRDLDQPPGLSHERTQRLVAIAGAARAGLLDGAALREMAAEDALTLVRQLPGIGPFSAELIVSRGAGHPDVFPAYETRLHTVMAAAYRTHELDELEAIAKRWQPYRSWASFLLRAVAPFGGQSRER
ncbi:DNA-3-methyladenine glycosylase 2 family protein [Saccharomonospora sp. NPDC046836]|uniref:DNA-3-methyladenine glycosylase family protein n=1 Tax=Saccharomonospora sp. NPDC046836 TaxID=3156921 RepID=UPI0033F03A91